MKTIDLTSYPTISQNQSNSASLSSYLCLHGIDLGTEREKCLLINTINSTSTLITANGLSLLGYTGYAVLNDEIINIVDSIQNGSNVDLTVIRGALGTVAQTINTIDKDYIFPVKVFSQNEFRINTKTDISESDLWGYSLDNNTVDIIDKQSNWNYNSNTKLYNAYINKEIFVFMGATKQLS